MVQKVNLERFFNPILKLFMTQTFIFSLWLFFTGLADLKKAENTVQYHRHRRVLLGQVYYRRKAED